MPEIAARSRIRATFVAVQPITLVRSILDWRESERMQHFEVTIKDGREVVQEIAPPTQRGAASSLPENFKGLPTAGKAQALMSAVEVGYDSKAVLDAIPVSLQQLRSLSYNESRDTFYEAFNARHGLDNPGVLGQRLARLEHDPPIVHDVIRFEALLSASVPNREERDTIRDQFYGGSLDSINDSLRHASGFQRMNHRGVVQTRQELTTALSSCDSLPQGEQLAGEMLSDHDLPEQMQFLLQRSALLYSGLLESDATPNAPVAGQSQRFSQRSLSDLTVPSRQAWHRSD